MPVLKLTERAVARLRAPDASGRQMLYFDTELKGLAVLVSGVSNVKSYVVQRPLPGGKTRRVTIAQTNVISLADAIEEAKLVLATFYRGQDPKATRRGEATLRSALDDYLTARADLKPRSAAAYRASVELHLSPWLDLPMRDVTRDMVEDRLRAIAKGVAGNGNRTGNATANLAMRAFRVLYNYVADRAPAGNPLPANPVRLRKVWLPVEPRTRSVKAEELPKFYRAVCELPNAVARDYLLFTLFTGFRRREAAALRWSEVDLRAKVIRLPGERTKASRPLDLPMTDLVYDLLVARRAIGGATFVFPSSSRSGHIEEPKFPLRMVAATSGIAVSIHDLRRTFITTAEGTDMSVMALKSLVNHSLGPGVTEGYIQMTAERLREPAQKVADRLKVLCGIAPVSGQNIVRIGDG